MNVHTASRSTKDRAYQAVVRPLMEYEATVWDPHQKHLMNAAEMVQRWADSYVTNTYDYRASVTRMLRELLWQSPSHRGIQNYPLSNSHPYHHHNQRKSHEIHPDLGQEKLQLQFFLQQ